MSGFPPDFWWGVSTSAYQIEGAVRADGRGASIWDTFSHTPGTISDGGTGDVATDHWHRYRQDVDLMARLGVGAYRFSVSWPRVQPDGRGQPNAAGLAFYDRLVDELCRNDIRPVLTLYHWDLPQALQDDGGWGSRETSARFADYAQIVANALGDRVSLWTTVNEPWCAAFLGHATGEHAPGSRDPALALRAAHHLLLGHGMAARAVRSVLPSAPVSIALNLYQARPATDAAADKDAARKIDGIANRIFLDPLFGNEYPADVLANTRDITDWSFVQPGDIAEIAAPIDALGINYYEPVVVGAGNAELGPSPWIGCSDVRFEQPQGKLTAMGWRIDATGLTDLLARLHGEHPSLPILITENGAAFDDKPPENGSVADPERIAYLREHIDAVRGAIAGDVNVRGYFVWSLLDNFEWAEGYSKRFGLYYVDFETQERIPKESAAWYAGVIGGVSGGRRDG